MIFKAFFLWGRVAVLLAPCFHFHPMLFLPLAKKKKKSLLWPSWFSFLHPLLSVSSISFLVPPSPFSESWHLAYKPYHHSQLHCTCENTFDQMATHSSSSHLQDSTPGHPLQCTCIDWVLHHSKLLHLQNPWCKQSLHITSSPSAQLLPWHRSSASFRLQFLAPALGSQGLAFSCLDFPPPPAEIWFSDFIALSLMLTSPLLF